MPLTRIKTKGLGNAVSRVNIVDTGTEGTKVATGTTAQRGSSTGQWRYNSETGFNLFESKLEIDFPLESDDIIMSTKDKSLPDLDNSYIYEDL